MKTLTIRGISNCLETGEENKEGNCLGRDEHRGKDIIHRALRQMILAHVCTFMLLPTENAKGLFHSSAKWRQAFL